MSDLQDALIAWDKRWPYGPQKAYESVIVAAARRVANPDYEAAAQASYEVYEDASDYEWTEWTGLSESDCQMYVEQIAPAVDAALGITP